MNQVLWGGGVEAITYVGEDGRGLKIIHTRTTRSALRDPLENLIAGSTGWILSDLDLGKGAGTLAPYCPHLVGEGNLEVHPELKPVPFDEVYDKGSVLENIDEIMGQCAAHSCLGGETEPFDQQLLLPGGADASSEHFFAGFRDTA
ncbi:hypothetical protein FS837_003873 [Tulasnella sp. UAMH 9824]|nr:hypothetical protein FS837_003873 [Tulasnella sp. UAMH 9824]